MATSFVGFKGYGFWVSDALLELWLDCLASEVRRLPRIPAWLRDAAANWQIQAQGIATGAVWVGLDEYITNRSRNELLLALSSAALNTLRGHGDFLRSGDPQSVPVAELSPLAIQFARLLQGQITTTAASHAALPTVWSANLDVSAPSPFTIAPEAAAALAMFEPADILIPGDSPLPQPQNVFTFQEYKVYLHEASTAWWQTVRTDLGYTPGRAARFGREQVTLKVLVDRYAPRLPVYLLARCPLCGGQVSEAVDTFSFNGFGWNNKRMEPSGRGWLGATDLSDRFFHPITSFHSECEHTQLMLYGVHLNGREPLKDLGWNAIFIGSERPYVIPPLLEIPDTYAVMHSLPLGCLADDVWTPRHTIIFTTYFSHHPVAFQQALELYRTPRKSHIPRISPYAAADYNLLAWVQRQRLLWLEIANPQLHLATQPEAFPYGERGGREGRWLLQNTKQETYSALPLKPFQDGWFGY